MNDLKQYLESNLFNFTIISDNVFEIIDFGVFGLVCQDRILFTQDFELNLLDSEYEWSVDYYCFQFGENYFYTKEPNKLTFNSLKYLGQYKSEFDFTFSFLGLHGYYELLNGSKSYNEWIKKAKFLNINVLGICEKNTLAGTLKFQLSCFNNKVKPIIGEQIVVKDNDDLIQFKCFAKNELGWDNLLYINKVINVDNNGKYIDNDLFLTHISDLIIIIDTKYTNYKKIDLYKQKITDLYYQIDTVEFSNKEKDIEYLKNLKQFIDSDIRPVLISDAYYLDKNEFRAKQILNNISNVRDYKSENQYFKSLEENYNSLLYLFENENDWLYLFQESVNNLNEVSNRCNFTIQIDKKFLAEYILSDNELKEFGDKNNLFNSLIEQGLFKLKNKNIDKYIDRVSEEIEVINKVSSEFGNGVDYFLILWDIIQYCEKNNILVGIGRGSSSGSLISYLLGITKIDPFDYNLLFSRFLNEGRVENGNLPDVDIDFESDKRNEVKRYLEQKYGYNHVCSVGTYTTLQLKAALKDIARQNNIEFGTVNFVSQLLGDAEEWQDLFELSIKKPVLKKFISEYPNVIKDIQLILKQPKSNSIHACATIIIPPNKEIYQYFPVRIGNQNNEQIIVSEWEGNELEIAGFLKEDILGIKQLDKYAFILKLIEKNTSDKIDIYNLPLNDNGVFELFKKGHNGDIFQFGTAGLSSYCKQMQPDNIHELIDAVALYRPGAMDVNAHNEYILRKFGEREIVNHWHTSEILKNTYGLIVYQEQVMEVVSQLGGFNLVESDDIRRSMGKKKKEIIDKYKEQFISNVTKNGCPEFEAKEIWHELEVHASYSFNKSHAAAYAITGYIGQWLKYHYPLQYWTSAFQFDNPNPKKSNIGRFISEIRRTDNFIKIQPPHINESSDVFTSNPDKMEMYWSIIKVKQLGDKALEAILNEREKNGQFFSLEDFLSRVEKRTVNKAVVINLILSGSFDDIENLVSASDRKILIDKYYQFTGNKRDKNDIYLQNHEEYWWQIKQKEVSGFGFIDYKKVLKAHTGLQYNKFEELSVLPDKETEKDFIIIGLIKRVVVRMSKHEQEYCRLTIDSNNEEVETMIWNETFKDIESEKLEVGSMVAFNGIIVDDSYRKAKTIHSCDKTKFYFIN